MPVSVKTVQRAGEQSPALLTNIMQARILTSDLTLGQRCVAQGLGVALLPVEKWEKDSGYTTVMHVTGLTRIVTLGGVNSSLYGRNIFTPITVDSNTLVNVTDE